MRRLTKIMKSIGLIALLSCSVVLFGTAEASAEDEVKSGVKTGNDPRDFSHKIIPYYRYDDRDGVDQHNAYLFFMIPFTFPGTDVPSAVTFESPLYRWNEFDVGPDESGLADWTFRLIMKPFNTPFIGNTRASHIFFLEATVPSGATGVTGDQTILSPGYGPIISNSPNWFFAPIFFYDFAINNDSAAPDVDRLRARIFFQYAWKNGVYVLPELQLVYDFNADEFTGNFLPEIGYVYDKPPQLADGYRPSAPPGKAIYIKGGPGFSNDDPGDLDWRLEIGHRFLW